MGQYLAAGVAVRILVKKSRSRWYNEVEKFYDNKENIIKQVGKFIDLSHYDVKVFDDHILFNMDTKYFNDNIHESYLKFKKVLNLSDDSHKLDSFLKKIDNKDVEFNKENFPIILSFDENDHLQIKSDEIVYAFIDGQLFASNAWMFYGDENDLFSMCDVYIDYVNIYHDIEKIFIEDDRNLLTALNVLCNKVFKDGLTKDISFYING